MINRKLSQANGRGNHARLTLHRQCRSKRPNLHRLIAEGF